MPAPHPFWLQDWLQLTHILLVLRGSLPRPSGPCNSAPPPPTSSHLETVPDKPRLSVPELLPWHRNGPGPLSNPTAQS